MYSMQRIKRAAAALTVGLLLTVAFAVPAQAGSGISKGLTAQQLQAVKARSEAWNRYFRLGAFSPSLAAARQADERRAQAMNRYYHLGAFSPSLAAAGQANEDRAQAINRYYHLGRYTVVGVSSRFAWADAGIGAGAMLGAIIVAGGLAVGVRRRTTGKTSFPSTT